MILNPYHFLKNAAAGALASILFLWVGQLASVQGANVTLSWQTNPEVDIAFYRLHYGTIPGVYTQQINTGLLTTATAPNLSTGTTYFFAVKAYNLIGLESPFSTELGYTVPSQTPIPSPTAGPSPANISGTVSYCSDPTNPPVPGVTLSVTGGMSGATLSDSLGHYLFSSLPVGGSYLITPTKNRLLAGASGISTIDVIATQRHFLTFGTIPPGCQLSAADVNGDTVINTSDVIAIQRFALGFTNGIANVGTYRFTPASRTYVGLGNNQINQDYSALIFGDVASGFVYRQGDPGSEPPKIGAVAELTLPQVLVGLSVTNFTMAVTTAEINRGDKLVGFQGDLTFDETVVSFADNPVEAAGLTGDNWNVSANVLPGTGPIRTLRVSAYANDFRFLSGSGTLFNLNMIRVSNVPGASSPLIWADTSGEFLFIDADLNPQAPGSAPPGTISIDSAQ